MESDTSTAVALVARLALLGALAWLIVERKRASDRWRAQDASMREPAPTRQRLLLFAVAGIAIGVVIILTAGHRASVVLGVIGLVVVVAAAVRYRRVGR